MENIVGSFFSTDIPVLQELFRDQKSEWLIQFFTALGENPEVTKDRESKLKWTERVVTVVPPDMCLHTAYVFATKLNMSDESWEKDVIEIVKRCNPSLYNRDVKTTPECPIDADVLRLGKMIPWSNLNDVLPLLESIPYDHGSPVKRCVFSVVFNSGHMEKIAKLLDIHLAKLGREALQKHLEAHPHFVLYLHDEMSQLVEIYHQRGLCPLYILNVFNDIKIREVVPLKVLEELEANEWELINFKGVFK